MEGAASERKAVNRGHLAGHRDVELAQNVEGFASSIDRVRTAVERKSVQPTSRSPAAEGRRSLLQVVQNAFGFSDKGTTQKM